MKQYTTSEQTAKLIELGFVPGIRISGVSTVRGKVVVEHNSDFTIGGLIELLPQYLDYNGGVAGMPIDYYSLTIRSNIVMYCDPYMDWVEIKCDDHKELIDNLYNMILKLKEEGVI